MPHKDPEARKAYLRSYYERKKSTKWKNPDGSWKARPPEKIREYRRRRYQTDPEHRARHLSKQREYRQASGRWRRSGDCPICLREGVRLVWDHNHATGEFRAWICNPCNLALGHGRENPETLRRLALYAEGRLKP